ncbi:DNA polymerase [Candidatus Liberibacter solanacearum]|uniref:DNA-directed DNA polymerase n=1 Tax=Candidatus Liberibacter solanacearum TaxID=556287 RepID=A0A0F4VMJ0_9HYPH|nr:DNA polymerase [Candidatus Liberibacter solanacearum]KJZ82500.1 DNA polymerase I [Candidatus Liberibacter solanacearum]KQC48753.1 DNA polymerase [Candidatus Liberibacter solanacearum]
MPKLFIDIETRSPKPLPKVGVWAYAEEAKITLCAYAHNDETIKLWDCTANPVMPSDLLKHLKDDTVVCVAHNSLFERILFKKSLNITIPPRRWICTSILARINGLPASLKNACMALKFPETLTKMEEGKALIARFCKGSIEESPYDAKRANHVQAWQLFGEYCKRDVEATRELYKRLTPLSENERHLWLLDQEINDRGYAIDLNLVKKLQELIAFEREKLDEELKTLTFGVIGSSRKTDLLNKYLFLYMGLDLPDMAESTIATALSQPNITQRAKDILNNRLSSSQSAILKLNTLSGAVSPDLRLRGTLQFYGASRTGRWSGCVFQPQNLPRPNTSHETIEEAIESSNFPSDDPLRFASDCVRSCIIASTGKKLIVADLAGIEARVLAWIAGEQWKLNAFANGEDIYKTAYSKAFNVPLSDVTKDQRAIGKVMELALGYQGGARVFQKMASTLGLNLQQFSKSIKNTATSEDWEQAQRRCLWMQETHPEFAVHDPFIGTACELVKGAWRAKHQGVVQLWKDCGEAFDCVIKEGRSISARRVAGVPPLLMKKQHQNVFITLPSNRKLVYRDVKSDRSYLNTATAQIMRERTYGGKLTENIVQAISRDILATGMINATKAGYDIVLTVHDEIVCEVPDTPEFSSDELCFLMTQNPEWAKGLPLKAEGYEAVRYRK